MSEATRSIALQHAVQVAAGEGADAVIALAHKFHAFILHDVQPTVPAGPTIAKGADKPATPAKVVAPKPAKAAAAPAVSEEELVAKAIAEGAAKAEADGEVTKEDVGKAIAEMLGANKRAEAVALLKSFNASSASGVPPGRYAEFVEKAQGILLGA